ncbi:MAG: hypothetical protein RR461_02735 [Angelakisella sp.]
MAAKQNSPTKKGLSHYIDGFRNLRFRLRRLWKLPSGYKTSPALFGIILLTMTSLGVTLSSWVLVRLLPNSELIHKLAKEFPQGFIELVRSLPELLAAAPPSTTALTEVVVSQEAYILTYACGAATVFCFLLLVIALIRKW